MQEHSQIELVSVDLKQGEKVTRDVMYVGVVLLFFMVLYVYVFKSMIIKCKELNKRNTSAIKDRNMLNKRLETLISKRETKVSPFAYVFIDLDNFRQINDQLGYEVGNILLEKFANRLQDFSKEHFELYRFGGDEFTLIFNNITTKKKLESTLKKLSSSMLEPYIVTDEKIKVTLEYSAGVAIFPNDAKSKEELMSCADIALESIKRNGKNSVCFNSPLLMKKAENKYKLEQSIKTSFENGDFEVDFQPRFGLKERNKLWLVSLVYWNHPSLGKLKAEYFISYIEELGLITKLDELTLAKTCAKLKYFAEQGIEDVNIAINMSINQLKRRDFVANICSILDEYKMYSNRITLEINNLMDKNNLELYKDVLQKLKLRGITIAINNFEIMYDGIAALKQLPIDELKLNCDLLKKDLGSEDILKYIVKIAKVLEYKTTLVGIETKEQYDFAMKIGVDKVQGNYISKIIEPENMLENIRKYTKMKK